MQLSDPEKLILMMLSEIHEKLAIEDGIDANFVKSAIYSGNTWGLKWEYTGLFNNSEDTPPAVDEVANILDMWDFLEGSYAELSPQDKRLVAKEAAPYGDDPKFLGFDGNSDSQQIAIARFLVNDLNRFSRFKGRDLNSHMPHCLHGYRRMLQVFNPLRPLLADRYFSAVEISYMLIERAHPENSQARVSTSAP